MRRSLVLGCMKKSVEALADFAVQRVTAQVVVELDLFQAAWRAQALLVAGRHVAGCGHSGSFGFRAFKGDDVSWHKI